MSYSFSRYTRALALLSLSVMLFASPAKAKVPSNAELHQMIVGVMQKMETLQSENRTLKKQLASLQQGKAYASLSPTIVPASVRRELSPIKAVVRNVKQAPQVATNGEKREAGNEESNGLYGRLTVAYSAPNDIELKNERLSGTGSLSESAGFEVAIGKRVDEKWSFEIELARRNYEANRISSSTNGALKVADPSGDVDVYTAGFNGYYGLNRFLKFRPHLGAGLGAAYVKANGITTVRQSNILGAANNESYNVHAWAPAGNLMAGFTTPIGDGLDLDIGYKFTMIGDLTGSRDNRDGSTDLITINNFSAGLRYQF
jgi:opacity protein-like surface antigen